MTYRNLMVLFLLVGCSSNPEPSKLIDNDIVVDSTCDKQVSDTLSGDVYSFIKDDSCDFVRRTIQFKSGKKEAYYYDESGKTVLKTIERDSIIIYVIPDILDTSSHVSRYEAGNLIYNEYLTSFSFKEIKYDNQPLCQSVIELSKIEFDLMITEFVNDHYEFSLTQNELDNFYYFVNHYCFSSPM